LSLTRHRLTLALSWHGLTLSLTGHGLPLALSWHRLPLTGHGLTLPWHRLAFTRHRRLARRQFARLVQARSDFQPFADRLIGDFLLAGNLGRALARHLLGISKLLLGTLQRLRRGDLLRRRRAAHRLALSGRGLAGHRLPFARLTGRRLARHWLAELVGCLSDCVARRLLVLRQLGKLLGQIAVAAELLLAGGKIRFGLLHAAADLLLSLRGLRRLLCGLRALLSGFLSLR
jgi:hypothetical protein